MAAARKSISIADAVSYVLADHDSDLSDSDFEHSESESSSDEDQQHVVNEVAVPNFRRRIRTRGGINAQNATPQGRGRHVNQVTQHTKIFFHFLEEAVYNAFVIYNKVEEGKKHKFMQFKLEVVCQILQDVSVPPDPRAQFDRLKGHHFPTLIPGTQNKEKPQKRCIVCYKNNA